MPCHTLHPLYSISVHEWQKENDKSNAIIAESLLSLSNPIQIHISSETILLSQPHNTHHSLEMALINATNTISWGRHTPSPQATPNQRLRCALLDVLSSPTLGTTTYTPGPYFPTTRTDMESVEQANAVMINDTFVAITGKKFCYRRKFVAAELQTLLTTYGISCPESCPEFASAQVEISTWKETGSTTSLKFFRVMGHLQIFDKDNEVLLQDVWATVWSTEDENDVHLNMTWKCIALFFEHWIKIAHSDDGSELPNEVVQANNQTIEPFLEEGYIGIPGVRHIDPADGVMRDSFRPLDGLRAGGLRYTKVQGTDFWAITRDMGF